MAYGQESRELYLLCVCVLLEVRVCVRLELDAPFQKLAQSQRDALEAQSGEHVEKGADAQQQQRVDGKQWIVQNQRHGWRQHNLLIVHDG